MPNEAIVLLANVIALVVIGIAAARFHQYDDDTEEPDDSNP
ncbi:hypothetical protein [Ralstonia pseudosolanacearum]|nr:hypothetical protein [Ralstonia pseudosolanacearum]